MSSGGGSGGSGNQTNTFQPPDWTRNQWTDLTQAATTLYSQPQQQYAGQRIAPINDSQYAGMQQLANLSANNSPDYATARRMLQMTAAGSYENPYSILQTDVANNNLLGWANPYGGMSPAYQQMKQNALDDAARTYQTTIAPQTDAAFNHAGAFHAGGHDAAIAANQANLAKQLGNISTSMDVGQWQRSADLANQDVSRNVGIEESAINRGVQAQQADIDRAANSWAQERQNQLASFNPILQANQFDQQNARNLMGIGDIQRGYTQDLMNLGYQDWQNQMNYPQQMLDAYANMLARASGNYGTNMSIYNTPAYQANPMATAVGAGLLGAGAYQSGMFNGLFS